MGVCKVLAWAKEVDTALAAVEACMALKVGEVGRAEALVVEAGMGQVGCRNLLEDCNHLACRPAVLVGNNHVHHMEHHLDRLAAPHQI